MEESDVDAGNGVRVFPGCAKAWQGPTSRHAICESGRLRTGGQCSQTGAGFQAGSSDVVKSSLSPDSA